jgi:hypothetical protein
MAAAKQLWDRLTSALSPGLSDDSDLDEEARLPTAASEALLDVAPERDTGVRDALMSFDHILLFEDCAQDLLMETTSFREAERRLNSALEPLSKALSREIHFVDMELCYDHETRTFFVARDFERHAPFDVFFAGSILETDAPIAAAFAEFRTGAAPPLKTVTLNSVADDDGQTFPYRTADGYLVRPSTLTLLLKYGLRYLDIDELVEPPSESGGEGGAFARWPRTFGVTALLFDYMRGKKDRRRACAQVLSRHCNAYYRLPAALANALLAHLRPQKDPYYAANFKICLDFEVLGDTSVVATLNPSAVLTACYF